MCGPLHQPGSCAKATDGANAAVCADPFGIMAGGANTTLEYYWGIVRVHMRGTTQCLDGKKSFVSVIRLMCDPAAGIGRPQCVSAWVWKRRVHGFGLVGGKRLRWSLCDVMCMDGKCLS